MPTNTINVLLKTSKTISEKLRKDISKYGLNLSEFALLEALYQKGPLPVSALLDKVLVNNSSLSYALRTLKNQNYLSEKKDAGDKRIHIITLEEKGRKLLSNILPSHYNYIDELSSVLTKEEQGTLVSLLKILSFGGNK